MKHLLSFVSQRELNSKCGRLRTRRRMSYTVGYDPLLLSAVILTHTVGYDPLPLSAVILTVWSWLLQLRLLFVFSVLLQNNPHVTFGIYVRLKNPFFRNVLYDTISIMALEYGVVSTALAEWWLYRHMRIIVTWKEMFLWIHLVHSELLNLFYAYMTEGDCYSFCLFEWMPP